MSAHININGFILRDGKWQIAIWRIGVAMVRGEERSAGVDTRDNCSGKMPAKLRLASDTKSLDNSVTCDPGHRGPHRTRVTCHGSFIIDNCEVRRGEG